MDVSDFVKKQDAALKRYRILYKLLDFAAITIIFYLLLFYFKVDQVFSLLSSFEVRAGTSYNIIGIGIAFETVALTLIAGFFSLIVTLLLHRRDDRAKAMFMLEGKFPELHERLRTAYDNEKVDNLIVADLLGSVALIIKRIASSALFVKKRVVFALVIILISTTVTIFVVNSDIRSGLVSPQDYADLIEDLIGDGNSDEFLEFGADDSNSTSSGTENLTGDVAIIVVEGTPVDLSLPPGTGAGFENTGESAENDTNFDQSSPYEISVISSQTYYEELPEGYESVIKSYFEEMANA